MKTYFPIYLCASLLLASSNLCTAQNPVTFTASSHNEIRSSFEQVDSLRLRFKGKAAQSALEEISADHRISKNEAGFENIFKVYEEIAQAHIYSLTGEDGESKKLLSEIAQDTESFPDYLLADFYFVYGNYYHNLDNIQFDSAFIYYKKMELLTSGFERPLEDSLYYTFLWNRIGEVYQYGFYDFPNAHRYLKRSLDYREGFLDPMDFNMAISYYNQSIVERSIGEMILTEAYAKRALEIVKYNESVGFELITYNLLANSYTAQGKHSTAIEVFLQLIDRAKKFGYSDNWLSFAYRNLADSYAEVEAFNEAAELITIIIGLEKGSEIFRQDDYLHALYLDALCTYKKGDVKTADIKYKLAQIAYLDYFGPISTRSMYINYWYAEFLMETNRYVEALQEASAGLDIVVKLWEDKEAYDALWEMIISYELIGDIYTRMHLVDSALISYQLADNYLERQREHVVFSDSKLDFSNRYRDLYEKLINSAFLSSESRETAKAAIFQAIEKNKYQVLEQEYRRKQMLSKELDDSTSVILYQLEGEIEALELAYYESGETDEKIIIEINEIKREIRLLSNAEGNAGDEGALINNSLESFGNSLLDGDLVIELFTTEMRCYVILLNRQSSSLYSFPLTPEYTHDLKVLYEVLGGKYLQANRSEQLKQYCHVASAVYSPFYEFIEEFLRGEELKRMVIIPDGIFSQIPFEALLTKSCDAEKSFSDLPYLLHQVEIVYALSGRLYQDIYSANEASKKEHISLVAIGPSKGAFLENAQIEVQQIAEAFSHGTYFLDSQKRHLKSGTQGYNVIHLASHADIDQDNYQLNRLRFGGEEQDSLIIYNYELSQFDLTPDLVLLNACETSLGETFKGEGVYSFAQSLTIAGVKSILSSLWSINDATSAELVNLFYKELKKGIPVGRSLRSAKRNYLADAHPDVAHPYYWAYLVANGQTELAFIPENRGIKKAALWGLLVILVVLLITGIGLQQKNNLTSD